MTLDVLTISPTVETNSDCFPTYLEGSEIDLGGGSDHVSLVNSAKGDTVDLERTGNEEETGRKLTKGDNTLSTESTSEEDDDGSRSDGLTKLGGLVRLARDLGGANVVSGVVRGLVVLLVGTLSRLSRLGLTLVQTLLGVNLAARELADVRRYVGVAGHLKGELNRGIVREEGEGEVELEVISKKWR